MRLKFDAINMRVITESQWAGFLGTLQGNGYVIIPDVFTEEDCKDLKSKYSHQDLYRSIISMERYRFGKGEYKYFNYPLPKLVEETRKEFYPKTCACGQHMDELAGNR